MYTQLQNSAVLASALVSAMHIAAAEPRRVPWEYSTAVPDQAGVSDLELPLGIELAGQVLHHSAMTMVGYSHILAAAR